MRECETHGIWQAVETPERIAHRRKLGTSTTPLKPTFFNTAPEGRIVAVKVLMVHSRRKEGLGEGSRHRVDNQRKCPKRGRLDKRKAPNLKL